MTRMNIMPGNKIVAQVEALVPVAAPVVRAAALREAWQEGGGCAQRVQREVTTAALAVYPPIIWHGRGGRAR